MINNLEGKSKAELIEIINIQIEEYQKLASENAKQKRRIADLDKVIELAGDVSFFVKYNEYPVRGTSGFNELTCLLNNLDVGLRQLRNQAKGR